jgi:hypothetical protein
MVRCNIGNLKLHSCIVWLKLIPVTSLGHILSVLINIADGLITEHRKTFHRKEGGGSHDSTYRLPMAGMQGMEDKSQCCGQGL